MTNTKTFVRVSLSVEGIHAWPGVVNDPILNKEVGFLQFPHRHMFFFKAMKSVSHNDRDVEIIRLKRNITAYLVVTYLNDDLVLDFGNKSCEMLAHEILEQFDMDSVEVLEDNENGAVVLKLPEPIVLNVNESSQGFCEAIKQNNQQVVGRKMMEDVLRPKNSTKLSVEGGMNPTIEQYLSNSPIALTEDMVEALRYACEKENQRLKTFKREILSNPSDEVETPSQVYINCFNKLKNIFDNKHKGASIAFNLFAQEGRTINYRIVDFSPTNNKIRFHVCGIFTYVALTPINPTTEAIPPSGSFPETIEVELTSFINDVLKNSHRFIFNIR